jgi:DDE family transposase
LIAHLREELCSQQTKERFRAHEQAFTRQRVLTFSKVALLVLRGHKLGLQNALNKVFTDLDEVFRVPTASAYCQARQKLKPELFVHLNETVCADFYDLYESDSLVKLWRGHRLVGCDGTYLTLPDNEETRAQFSLQTNQYEDGSCVQALAVVVYDLRNDVGLAAGLGKRQGEKKLLFSEAWHATAERDVLVFDRHYADYTILAYALRHQRHVVVRLPAKTFNEAVKFWHSGKAEQIVKLKCSAKARKFVKENKLAEEIKVRLVRVELDNGVTEVLLTTLLDSKLYPASQFKEVYGWRWNEETFFDRIKNIFEVERFSGTTVTAIKQDFYGVLFLASLESVLRKRDEEDLSEQSAARENRTQAKVNHAVSYVALVERVVSLLLSESSTEQILDELHHLFRTNPTRVRTGRQHKRRKELRYAHKLRFHKYAKKIIA